MTHPSKSTKGKGANKRGNKVPLNEFERAKLVYRKRKK